MKKLAAVLIVVNRAAHLSPAALPARGLPARKRHRQRAAGGRARDQPARRAGLAAVGIWRDARWGWALGLVIAVVAVGMYLVQHTVDLPGLPKNWAGPSRIVSLTVQALFIVVAVRQLRHHRGTPAPRSS